MNCRNGHTNPPRYPPRQNQKTGQCKLCHAIIRKKYWRKRRSKCKKDSRLYDAKYAEHFRFSREKYNKEYGQKMRLKVLTHYCNGVLRCMNPKCKVTEFAVLDLDHINGNGRAHRSKVGDGTALYKWLIDNNFPPILQVLCANCHRAKHAGTSWL